MGGSVLPSKTSNRAIKLAKKCQRETTKLLVAGWGENSRVQSELHVISSDVIHQNMCDDVGILRPKGSPVSASTST